MMRPPRYTSLLLAYYGDDFTGSTDVMESLSCAGVKTVLFLKPPTPSQLAQFPGLRAFGIAGGSRAMSPQQMERALPPVFKALKASGAPFIHYKTCSTFDSSPEVGSIGKAIELGRRAFGKSVTPLVVGVPVLGRYVVFGNLFARSGLDAEPSRLDRHPTMRHHPVTPMDEADIRLHLARQTNLPIELLDVLKLRKVRSTGKGGADSQSCDLVQQFEKLPTRPTPPIVLFDTFDEADLPVIGRLISRLVPGSKQLFCAGSSGIEYALAAHWHESGLLHAKAKFRAALNDAPQSRQIVAISGSCSPVTDRQIERARGAGFVDVPCDSRLLADQARCPQGVAQAMAQARKALEAGHHVIFHTARGSRDPRRAGFESSAKKNGGTTRVEKLANAGASLAKGLAQILSLSMNQTGARRAVVCGGDTATHVARSLGIEALEFLSPFTPGGPLCRVHAPRNSVHGCHLIFKGGQVGADSFFRDLANGGPL